MDKPKKVCEILPCAQKPNPIVDIDWHKCVFSPIDVLVSADARPLGDEGGWGHEGTIFPQAFAGAIRTRILQEQGFHFAPKATQSELAAKAAERIGHTGENMDFRFFGPFFASTSDADLQFPLPRFVLATPGYRMCACRLTVTDRPLNPGGNAASLRALQKVDLDGTPEKTAEYVPEQVPAETLCELMLEGAAGNQRLGVRRSASPPYRSERRWSHKRGATDTIENEGLFSRAVQRFEDDIDSTHTHYQNGYGGFVAGVMDYLAPQGDDPSARVLKLAGDGHPVEFSISSTSYDQRCFRKLREAVLTSLGTADDQTPTYLMMYLATPALFAGGWRPTKLDGLDLVAAAVGKPEIVAGWDLRKQCPRPVRRAVPAGSTYWFSLPDKEARERAIQLVKQFHFNESVSDFEGCLGYGMALFGIDKGPTDDAAREPNAATA